MHSMSIELRTSCKHALLVQGNSELFLLQFRHPSSQLCIVFSLLTLVSVRNHDFDFSSFLFFCCCYDLFKCNNYPCMKLCMDRCRRSQLPTVLQFKQLQNQVHTWVLNFHGILHTPVLQRLYSSKRLRSCPHWS